MTNKALQAMIAEFGEKIFCIILDNNHKIFFGVAARLPYEDLTVTHIVYKTYDGVDMFGVPHTDHTWEGKVIPYTNWFPTSCIQGVAVTNAETDDLPDLNKFF